MLGALETDLPVASADRCSGISASTDRVKVVRNGEGAFRAGNGVLPWLVGLVGALRWGEARGVVVNDVLQPAWASSKVTDNFCEK